MMKRRACPAELPHHPRQPSENSPAGQSKGGRSRTQRASRALKKRKAVHTDRLTITISVRPAFYEGVEVREVSKPTPKEQPQSA